MGPAEAANKKHRYLDPLSKKTGGSAIPTGLRAQPLEESLVGWRSPDRPMGLARKTRTLITA